VTINSALANTIFSVAIEKGLLKGFEGCTIVSRERRIERGRIDFLLLNRKGGEVYVEVKSCTHVEKGVAKFPDRPTERGKRHLAILSELVNEGKKCYIVFVVQRPDAKRFEPFGKVDPEFTDSLKKAIKKGVGAVAVATEFRPPNLYLRKSLPISFRSIGVESPL
jgi:sugar fermentation stimulation protein A